MHYALNPEPSWPGRQPKTIAKSKIKFLTTNIATIVPIPVLICLRSLSGPPLIKSIVLPPLRELITSAGFLLARRLRVAYMQVHPRAECALSDRPLRARREIIDLSALIGALICASKLRPHNPDGVFHPYDSVYPGSALRAGLFFYGPNHGR